MLQYHPRTAPDAAPSVADRLAEYGATHCTVCHGALPFDQTRVTLYLGTPAHRECEQAEHLADCLRMIGDQSNRIAELGRRVASLERLADLVARLPLFGARAAAPGTAAAADAAHITAEQQGAA